MIVNKQTKSFLQGSTQNKIKTKGTEIQEIRKEVVTN